MRCKAVQRRRLVRKTDSFAERPCSAILPDEGSLARTSHMLAGISNDGGCTFATSALGKNSGTPSRSGIVARQEHLVPAAQHETKLRPAGPAYLRFPTSCRHG